MAFRLAPPARHTIASMKQALLAANQPKAQQKELPPLKSLTSAALPVNKDTRVSPNYSSWQYDAWGFYKSLGEFRFVVDWKASMTSRVRLCAAKREPGNPDPIIQETGIGVDIVNDLQTVTGDQSQLMGQMSLQINVPGECWLIGETIRDKQKWRVCSSEEIRTKGQQQAQRFEVISENSAPGNVVWRSLASDSMVVRVWKPDPVLSYMADSPVSAALSTMRELELLSRHMQSQYMSRLASAGVFLMPSEVTYPVREEFLEDPDPFVREWIETAAEAIRTPGAASGVIPMPMRVPSEYIDNFKFIDFTLKLDGDIVSKYSAAVRRLATQLDAPPEILVGMGATNHWSGWLIDETAVKAHILPSVEVIVNALTIGYLHPQLEAMGEPAGDWVVWYDPNEIVIRPDKSDAARDAFDRYALSSLAYRREAGFNEDDAPTEDELKARILARLATKSFEAYSSLFHEGIGATDIAQDDGDEEEIDESKEVGEAPDPGDNDPELDDKRHIGPPEQAASSRHKQLLLQGNTEHALRISLNNYELLHPRVCERYLVSCPFTYAVYSELPVAFPGRTGTYSCTLNQQGLLVFGERILTDTRHMLETTLRKKISDPDRNRVTVL